MTKKDCSDVPGNEKIAYQGGDIIR